MTHIENVRHILKNGITHAGSSNANEGFTPIGDGSLIISRSSFVMPGDKTLGEYIPFYFGVRMPMLYVIQYGFNGVKATGPENIIYCISSVATILQKNIAFIFTDGHAINSFSSFYDKTRVNDIERIIDFEAVKRKYWVDEKDLDVKRRKEAEFLVAENIPVDAIIGYGVYNEKAGASLLKLGIDSKQIVVKPTYYF